jgi:flagellin-like protein
MKILKSKKALSPVVASIILIAVTVAVSIAVAAWMGALTFTFMGTEEVRIDTLSWAGGNSGFSLKIDNTGTKEVTITQIQVNYGTADVTQTLPMQLVTGPTGTVTLDVTYTYVNGSSYDVSVVTQSGYKFTDHFVGGQNKV